jgi:hypothetical protein
MHFSSPRLRRALALGLIATAAACGGKDNNGAQGGDESGASADEVDQKSEASVTDRERAAFNAPADSSITPQQVEAYLRTSLLQFDLIRSEAPNLHKQVQAMEERAKDGGVLSGLRNAAQGISTMAQWGDLVGGSYVRSARTLKQNPAEMEYVRERMAAVSGYLMMKPMQDAAKQSADQMRQQANAMKGQPGITDDQVQAMLQSADEMERNAAESSASPALRQNLEAIRRARGNVTDAMWTQIGLAGGGMGLLALTGLGDPADTATVNKLNQFRQLYTDALANKVTPGMENKPAEGQS